MKHGIIWCNGNHKSPSLRLDDGWCYILSPTAAGQERSHLIISPEERQEKYIFYLIKFVLHLNLFFTISRKNGWSSKYKKVFILLLVVVPILFGFCVEINIEIENSSYIKAMIFVIKWSFTIFFIGILISNFHQIFIQVTKWGD